MNWVTRHPKDAACGVGRHSGLRPASASASKMDDVVATPTSGEAMRKSMDNEVRRRVRATVVTPRFGWTSSPRQRPSARHDASLLTSLVPHPQFLYTRSQADLLSATSLNPTPTTGSSDPPEPPHRPPRPIDRSIDRSDSSLPSQPSDAPPSLDALTSPLVSFRAPAQSLPPSPRSPGTSASATSSCFSVSRWSASAPSRSA